MDILTALPLELSMRVLKYLTPATTIQLRLVSKSYYSLLASEGICSFLSHQFITPEYNSTKVLSSWKLHYENHVSRRLSFASGKSWDVRFLGSTNDLEVTLFCPETLRLVLLTGPGDSVSVQDLNTHPPKCILPPTRAPDRSPIMYAALLPSFVAVATAASHGYVWNLETHKEHQFKLPKSPIRGMHGSGNLVAIYLEGWLIIHDVQAEETSTFKDTRSNIRVWEGEEFRVHDQRSGIIINPEKQVVWMISKAGRSGHYLLVIDSFHLETGGFVQRDIHESPYHCANPFYSGNGHWLILEHRPCGCLLGRNSNQRPTKRVILDQATGLTVEYFPVEFPANCEIRGFHHWGPAISSGGLGCFIDGCSGRILVFDRGPGDEVLHARPLDLGIPERPLKCIWFCDKFVVFCTEVFEVYMVRFKGIHDDYNE